MTNRAGIDELVETDLASAVAQHSSLIDRIEAFQDTWKQYLETTTTEEERRESPAERRRRTLSHRTPMATRYRVG